MDGALAAILVALVGGSLTARGFGPLSQVFGVSEGMRPILLQLFVISAVAMMFSVSVVLDKEKSAERRLREIASIHSLITENSREAIILSDFDGTTNYVSPAVESLYGWNPEECMHMEPLALVHTEDRDKLADVLREMRSGSEGTIVEYRVRTRRGEYIWVESSLRTIRDASTRVTSGALNIVRDISERKLAEEQLEAAYRAVEALSVEDALTGIANRRKLDESLSNEWRRGIRNRKPLSFLLLDVDYFKSFNDTYGHPSGDVCLKEIAQTIAEVVARPGDLVARYGGEEFAVVLPYSDETGALELAGKICDSLRVRALVHSANPDGIVTISIGCATLVPSMEQPVQALVEMADRALYRAKSTGRNRVCSADPPAGPGQRLA